MNKHLSRLRASHDIPTSPDDGGLLAVLQTFAVSLGYTIVNKPFVDPTKLMGARAMIHTVKKLIYVKDDLDNVTKAECLAHEIAHHYDFHLSGLHDERRSLFEVEMIAEALAVCICAEYGVNRFLEGKEYIDYYETEAITHWMRNNFFETSRPKLFSEGTLDNWIDLLYTSYTQDLTEFLQDI